MSRDNSGCLPTRWRAVKSILYQVIFLEIQHDAQTRIFNNKNCRSQLSLSYHVTISSSIC